MKKRIKSVRHILEQHGLDGFMVTKQENWQYLSGFTGSSAILLFTVTGNYLFTDFRYIDQAVAEAHGFQIIRPFALMEDALVDRVNKLGLKRIGFEDDNLTYHQYSVYKKKLAGAGLVPVHRAVERVRRIKDREETAALRLAAAITDDAFTHILDYIKPGVRESEIALEIDYYMRKKGAEKAAFDIIVASGPRAAMPHGVASEKKIAPGELIILDFGAVVKGYHSDMTRTVILGKSDHRQREVYDLVLKAQKQAIKAIRPGAKCSDVDMVARDLISINGYGANFGHGLGHSVGLEIHESPSLSPKDETVLEEGMALTVEPGIYLSNWGGVRIEDLVMVTPGGQDILSRSPKELIEL